MAKIRHEIDNSAAVQAERGYQREKEKTNKGISEEVRLSKVADNQTQRFLKRAQTEQQKWTRAQAEGQTLIKREPRLRKEIEASLERQRRAIFGVGKAVKATNTDQQKLLELGKRITRDLETPTERYKRKVLELGRAYRSGAISQETFVRGTRKLKAELADATAQVGDAGRAGKEAFGPSLIDGVKNLIGPLGSAAGGAAALANEFGKVEQRAQAAADNVSAAIASIRELSQISDTPKDFASNTQLVERLVAEGIVKPENRTLGAEIDFALNSATRVDQEEIIKLGRQKVVRAERLGDTAAAVNTAIESIGAEETGSTRDLLNKAIAAAGPTRATFPQMLEALSGVGSQLNVLGFTDEAGSAALSVLTRKTKSASESETRLKAFLAEVDKRGLSQGSLLKTVDSIQARIEAGEKVQDILGSNREGIEAFRGLRDARDLFAGEIQRIERSQTEDPLAIKLSLVDSNPVTRAAKQKDIAEGELAVEISKRSAERELTLDLAVADLKAQNLRLRGPTRAFIANTELSAAAGFADAFQTERNFLATRLAQAERGETVPFTPEVEAMVRAFVEGGNLAAQRMAGAADRIAAAAEKLPERTVPSRQE